MKRSGKNASPLTADEIRRLRPILPITVHQLVPNQNSFGHMERWLRHPRYLPLAEAPDGAETPWGFRWNGPFSLCPIDTRSLDLLDDLYSQLLPTSPAAFSMSAAMRRLTSARAAAGKFASNVAFTRSTSIFFAGEFQLRMDGE